MVIQHNLSAINSYRRLGKNKSALNKNLEKLSSGYKINRSGDDAAGLAISEGLRALINGTKQAENNTQDGIGLIRTAEGAMQEIHSMLGRAYELSIAAANGTYNDQERQIQQEELDQLKQEIERITESTNFNGIPLLKGTRAVSTSYVAYEGTLPAWVKNDGDGSLAAGYLNGKYVTTETFTPAGSPGATHQIEHAAARLDFTAYTGTSDQKQDLKKGGFYTTCFTCDRHYSIRFTDGTTNSQETSGDHFIYNIGIDNINTASDLVKAIVSGADSGNPNNHYTKLVEDPSASGVLIVYDDRSQDSSPVAGSGSWGSWKNPSFNVNHTSYPDDGLIGKGIAVKGKTEEPWDIALQIGPSQEEILKIKLPNTTHSALVNRGGGLDSVSISTQAGASSATKQLKEAIEYLSGERGRMGAYENRLEHAYQVLANNNENLTAAESRIRDTDMADEITAYTKNNILLQAAQSMLVQANSVPQGVLSLLQ